MALVSCFYWCWGQRPQGQVACEIWAGHEAWSSSATRPTVAHRHRSVTLRLLWHSITVTLHHRVLKHYWFFMRWLNGSCVKCKETSHLKYEERFTNEDNFSTKDYGKLNQKTFFISNPRLTIKLRIIHTQFHILFHLWMHVFKLFTLN